MISIEILQLLKLLKMDKQQVFSILARGNIYFIILGSYALRNFF